MPNTSEKALRKKHSARTPRKQIKFETGSGNVFADIGLEDPEVALAKSDLVCRINSIIEVRGLTQVEAARLLGVDQPKVSALRRGRLDEFSIERLIRFLRSLEQRIEISVVSATSKRTLVVTPSEPKVPCGSAVFATSQTAAFLLGKLGQVAGPYSVGATLAQGKADENVEHDILLNAFALVAGQQGGYSYAQEE
jgi:predicted XRE-type DNA-binding protein